MAKTRVPFSEPLTYFVTEQVWLSLESYYNAGMTSARAKEIIERVIPESRCEKSGLNGNWIVNLPFNVDADRAVNSIRFALTTEINRCVL